MTKRILLVEDDEDCLEDVKAKLEKLGLMVDTASYMKAAVNYIETETYDLVVSDYMFPIFEGKGHGNNPECMGLDLLLHVKMALPVMPQFILHTSSEDAWVKEKAEELGGSYFHKRRMNNALIALVKEKLAL